MEEKTYNFALDKEIEEANKINPDGNYHKLLASFQNEGFEQSKRRKIFFNTSNGIKWLCAAFYIQDLTGMEIAKTHVNEKFLVNIQNLLKEEKSYEEIVNCIVKERRGTI
jgi:hypothetical protein